MGKPERIAQIIGKMWAGGVEAVVFNYYRAIDHDKYQFDFYYDEDSTVLPPQDLIEMGARFYKLPPYQRLPEYIRELRHCLKKENYRIIHSHLNTLSVFPLYAAWKEHIPVRIAHNHSVPAGKEIKRNTAKYVLRMFSRVYSTDYFACSEKAGRWLFGDKEFDKGHVQIIRNALDFKRFQFSDGFIAEQKKALGLNDRFVVGHVGRFTFAKNHHFLLKIFQKVLKFKPDAVLLLVGDGELHDEIINDIHEKKLDSSVLLVGKVSDPESYYRMMNVLVLPSVFEGLPLTAIESQASGIPVVMSRVIPQEAVISSGCFYKDLSDSPEEWARTVLDAWNKEVILGPQAKEYDINNAVKILEKKYEKLTEGI